MTRIERRRTAWRAPAAVLVITIAGCGGPADGFERFPAWGTVTLDGQPLKSGTISFVALQQGASSSGPIVDGAFKLSGNDGLSPGPYRVEVFSMQTTGKKIPSGDDPSSLVDETINAVPKQYNVDSTLRTEIPAGGPKDPLAFPLVSTPAKKGQR